MVPRSSRIFCIEFPCISVLNPIIPLNKADKLIFRDYRNISKWPSQDCAFFYISKSSSRKAELSNLVFSFLFFIINRSRCPEKKKKKEENNFRCGLICARFLWRGGAGCAWKFGKYVKDFLYLSDKPYFVSSPFRGWCTGG